MAMQTGASRVEVELRLVVVDRGRRVRSLSISAVQALVVGADPSADIVVEGVPAWGLVVPSVEGPCVQGREGVTVQVRREGRGVARTLAAGEGQVLQAGDQIAVEIGSLRILAAVIAAARPVPAPRFRAGVLYGHDPLFDGLVGLFGAAALVMSVAVARAERVVDLAPPPEDVIAWLPIVQRPPPIVRVEAPRQPPPSARPAAGAPSAKVRPEATPRRGVGALLRTLGTHGPSHEDWTVAIAENGELEQALSTVGGVETASLERDGLRGGGPVTAQTEAAIGGIGVHGGGNAELHRVEEIGPVRRPAALAEVVPSADLNDDLRAGLRQGAASVRACYERSLHGDPSLRGRLVLTLAIGAGRVQEATITGGDLHQDALTTCVERAALRWRFDASVTAPAVAVPFALSPG